MRLWKILVVIPVILLILLMIPHNTSPQGAQPGVGITLVVEHYRQGKLIERVVKEGDPCTQNFLNLVSSFFSGSSFTMKDTSGSSYTFNALPALSSTAIAIGSGTTSFSISDYKLATQVASTPTSSPTESVTGTRVNATVSASFSISSAVTISEVGLIGSIKDSGGTARSILLIRDVLPTPINAAAGDTVTVTYVIRVNP